MSEKNLPFGSDQVAVITGASSGIGRGAAVKLAQKGITKFCLTARNREGLEETKKLCMEHATKKTSEENFVLVAGYKTFNIDIFKKNLLTIL